MLLTSSLEMADVHIFKNQIKKVSGSHEADTYWALCVVWTLAQEKIHALSYSTIMNTILFVKARQALK